MTIWQVAAAQQIVLVEKVPRMLAHDEGLAQYLTVQLIPTHGIQWGTMPLLEAVARGSAHSDRPMHVQSHRHWGFDATFMPHQL